MLTPWCADSPSSLHHGGGASRENPIENGQKSAITELHAVAACAVPALAVSGGRLDLGRA